ncbi:MAG: 3-isopropylmalate dehydratase small subunit [Alphaproteobacteria bacterium]|nr:3-isopropylmalate dehydratase small subunit [Alphaproteobacteria bacterium]
MEKISIITSRFVPINIENIDTDQIIPARFLKSTSKLGYGKNLFRDWRYENDDEAQPISNFPLNSKIFSGNILVCGKNFGCGSSREHAAWAIKDYGFQVVISSFLADIFYNNALNNGILPINVSPDFLNNIFQCSPEDTLTINLLEKQVIINKNNHAEQFHINEYKQTCLINGFDDIDFLVSIKDKIVAFETQSK